MSSLSPELRAKLESIVTSDAVVLFMKGSRSFPQCGFSARVVGMLNTLIPKYTTVNVLSDPDVRQGMKELSDWPTFPQLYVNGEFVGGADIVGQMFDSGELATRLGVEVAPAAPPEVTITPRAGAELRAALAEAGPGDVVHLTIDERFEHALDLGGKEAGHLTIESGGVTLQVDRASAGRAAGVVIDFIDGPGGSGFKIENPNRPPGVKAVRPPELKALLDRGEVKELFDVRTPQERSITTLEPSRLFDDDAVAYLDGLPRDTPIVFFCHHGNRSQSAALHFLGKGFTRVYNLAGGLEAWAREVDPKMPRY
jgi:monothiol glutaredoxin